MRQMEKKNVVKFIEVECLGMCSEVETVDEINEMYVGELCEISSREVRGIFIFEQS